jgi:hypothetical protein
MPSLNEKPLPAPRLSPAAFRQDVARRLFVLGMPADPQDLAAWLASCWPLVEDAPDAGRWAREYAEAVRAGY